MNLRYSYEASQRKTLFTIAKIALFIALGSYLFLAGNLLFLILPLLTYILYVSELYYILLRSKGVNWRHSPAKSRQILTIGLAAILFAVIAITISLPLSNSLITGYQDMLAGAYGSVYFVAFPSIISFTIVAALVLIALDLATPLIVSLLIFVTYPADWLRQQLIFQRLRQKLLAQPTLRLIAISGSLNEAATASIIAELVSSKYQVTLVPGRHTTNTSLARAILQHLPNSCDILIYNIDPLSLRETKELSTLLPADILVLVDADGTLPYSPERILRTKLVLAKNIRPGGVLVVNGDDEICFEVAKKHQGNELVYFVEGSNKNLLSTTHPLLLNYLQASNARVTGGKLSFDLTVGSSRLGVITQSPLKQLTDNYLAALGVALALGMDLATAVARLSEVSPQHPLEQTTKAINQSMAIIDAESTTTRSFIAALDYFHSQSAPRKILVTRGLAKLGRTRHLQYSRIIKHLKGIDLLMTTDPVLAHAAWSSKLPLQVQLERSQQDLIYLIHKQLKPQDLVMLAGELTAAIIDAVISEE